jgi:hypothetical protein
MVWLKACPRCKGDLFLDEDNYGKFQSCLQCGYMRDLSHASRKFLSPTPIKDGTNGELLDVTSSMRSSSSN